MTCIYKTDLKSVTDFDLFLIITRHKMAQYAHRIIHIIKRHHFRFSGPFCLTIAPFCLEHLDMCTVFEHNVAEFIGR